MRVENKVVLITGASAGIGAACAAAFRNRGARLCLTARSDGKLRESAAAADLVVKADLFDPSSPVRIVRTAIDHFGRIDVLVNNAGAGLYMPAHQSPPALSRQLFDLDFFAPLDLIRAAVPHIKAERRRGNRERELHSGTCLSALAAGLFCR